MHRIGEEKMSLIYENPTEYAKTCQCDVALIEKRCEIYATLYRKMEQAVCPCCQADNEQLVFDNDGSDYPSQSFISCTECGETFDVEHEQLQSWVRYQEAFDEVLAIAISGIEKHGITDWFAFVEESTQKLIIEFS